jgi:hypothetical protein
MLAHERPAVGPISDTGTLLRDQYLGIDLHRPYNCRSPPRSPPAEKATARQNQAPASNHERFSGALLASSAHSRRQWSQQRQLISASFGQTTRLRLDTRSLQRGQRGLVLDFVIVAMRWVFVDPSPEQRARSRSALMRSAPRGTHCGASCNP